MLLHLKKKKKKGSSLCSLCVNDCELNFSFHFRLLILQLCFSSQANYVPENATWSNMVNWKPEHFFILLTLKTNSKHDKFLWNSLTHSMDMSLKKFQEIVKDKKAWHTAVHGVAKNWTQLSNWTRTNERSLISLTRLSTL